MLEQLNYDFAVLVTPDRQPQGLKSFMLFQLKILDDLK